jgi:hypothetical protein
MVITASLHMLFSTMLARPLLNIIFLILYPMLIACLAVGHYKMIKAEKAATAAHL